MGTGRWDDDGRRDQGRSPRNRRMDDDPRQSRMGSRDGGSSGWDRSSRDGSRYPRRDVDDQDNGGRGGSYNRGGRAGSSNRGGWDDPRGSRGGPPDRSGDRSDRSMRGGRPPVREDWDAPSRGRGGPGGSGGGYPGASRRPPQGGGLWGDEPRGGRPPMRDPRDPRAARAGGRRPMAPEPEKGEFTFGRSAGIIAGMFLLGVGVAFIIFMVTRPTPQLDNTPAVPTNTAPAVTPSVAPKVTPSPSGFAPGAGPAYVVVSVGAIG